MRSFSCVCSQTLFFASTQCVSCGRPTAMCPACGQVTAIESEKSDRFRCANCQTELCMCQNRVEHAVCNSAVLATSTQTLCRFCRLNRVIPDLTVAGNLAKWRLLEAAKHRVLYDVCRISLPIISQPEEGQPVLRFEFKSSGGEPVSTGHANGLITIDLAEADSVYREQVRVVFGEPQRTLVGHFRHELGHYYWELLVAPNCLAAFRERFGDERKPSYEEARQRYYASGPPVGWQGTKISAYAAMHPWEDFAETFAGYLDMVAILETAKHFQSAEINADHQNFDAMVDAYRDIGVFANEVNRDMGLIDLVPEVFTKHIIEKMRFVHGLR